MIPSKVTLHSKLINSYKNLSPKVISVKKKAFGFKEWNLLAYKFGKLLIKYTTSKRLKQKYVLWLRNLYVMQFKRSFKRLNDDQKKIFNKYALLLANFNPLDNSSLSNRKFLTVHFKKFIKSFKFVSRLPRNEMKFKFLKKFKQRSIYGFNIRVIHKRRVLRRRVRLISKRKLIAARNEIREIHPRLIDFSVFQRKIKRIKASRKVRPLRRIYQKARLWRSVKRRRFIRRARNRWYKYNLKLSRRKLLRRFLSKRHIRVGINRTRLANSIKSTVIANKVLFDRYYREMFDGGITTDKFVFILANSIFRKYVLQSSVYLKITEAEKLAYLDRLNIPQAEKIRLLKL